jgi:hypothetical protein
MFRYPSVNYGSSLPRAMQAIAIANGGVDAALTLGTLQDALDIVAHYTAPTFAARKVARVSACFGAIVVSPLPIRLAA